MKETYTEVLCEASEDLLHALNDTPQRYIPARVQGCMLGLRSILNSNEANKQIKVTSEEIEDGAEELIDELDELSGSVPSYIVSYVRNLRSIIAKRGIAS